MLQQRHRSQMQGALEAAQHSDSSRESEQQQVANQAAQLSALQSENRLLQRRVAAFDSRAENMQTELSAAKRQLKDHEAAASMAQLQLSIARWNPSLWQPV